jgi:hypothetical protein
VLFCDFMKRETLVSASCFGSIYSVPSARVKQVKENAENIKVHNQYRECWSTQVLLAFLDCLMLEDGTNKLFCNVGKCTRLRSNLWV